MSEFYSFLRMSNIPLYLTMFCLPSPLSVDGHLHDFYLSAIMSNAAMNMGVYISV